MDMQQFAVNMRQKFSFTSQYELPDTTMYRWKLKKQYLQLPVSLNTSGNVFNTFEQASTQASNARNS
jgi:hypothetical protein